MANIVVLGSELPLMRSPLALLVIEMDSFHSSVPTSENVGVYGHDQREFTAASYYCCKTPEKVERSHLPLGHSLLPQDGWAWSHLTLWDRQRTRGEEVATLLRESVHIVHIIMCTKQWTYRIT
jgi:hypothetical protein